jgi:chromosome segregation ATPase
MKREFLKELGLDDSVIDKVMAENGKDVEKQKKEAEKAAEKFKNLETELETNKKTLDDANTQIQKFKGMDIEGIQKSANEWKSKYETFQTEVANQKTELEKKMKAQEYEFAAKDYVNGLKFTNDFTKNAFLKEFMSQELKLAEGKFLGADDYISKFKETNPGVLADEAKDNTLGTQNQNTYVYKPQGGNAGGQDLATQIAGAIAGTI